MSKLNTTLVVLSALALTLPSAAATISIDEVQLTLGGGAELVAPNSYQILPGKVAVLDMASNPGDIVWLFAVADDLWGEPDYGNILTLYFDKSSGHFQGFFEIPAALAGMVFHVQAVSVDSKGEFHSSPMLDIVIPGVQVLVPGN
jgi:hypothetical protein